MITAFEIRRIERLADLSEKPEAYKSRIGHVVALAILRIKKDRRRGFFAAIFRWEEKDNG